MDLDAAGAIRSTRKLLDLVEREQIALVVHGHDGNQWDALKTAPEFYD
jgi:N-acyl homoserine lactone hydrolase